MTGRLLDVSTMPFEQVYTCEDGSRIDLREFLDSHRGAIEALAAAGLVKANDSFGFAMLQPFTEADFLEFSDWDKLDELVWFAGGWGLNRDRYIANAVRKLRPLVRSVLHEEEPMSGTLAIRFYAPEWFTDTVDSQNDDGTFPWGDFPWGGAVAVVFDEMVLVGAVSALSEIEDDFVTRLILGGLSQRIIKGDGLLSDD